MNADAAPQGEAPPPAPGLAQRALFYTGSAGLLIATGADSIAVLGRHVGFQLHGAIEIVQAAIVFIASASMVATTRDGRHAAVHILTDRLSPVRRRRLARAASLGGALTALLLTAGSLILLGDLWDGHERSELLHIPLRWFRLLMIAALLFVALLFVRQAIAQDDRPGGSE